MRYTRQLEGIEVWVDVSYTGVPSFGASVLEGKNFDSQEKLAVAIKAWDLKQRKDFSNRTAYRVDRSYNGPSECSSVEVTSIDGTEAWIKTDKGRSKCALVSLFASEDEVNAAIAAESDAKRALKTTWDAVTKWTPKKEEA